MNLTRGSGLRAIRAASLVLGALCLSAVALGQTATAPSAAPSTGYCNPLNLNYRFALRDVAKETPFREAADPTIVLFKDEYWMFCSKSGGAWRSSDLRSWQFVPSSVLPSEDYAPDVCVIDGSMYFIASGSAVYKTDDPAADRWTKLTKWPDTGDPHLFQDDDGKVYFYAGCSDKTPIGGQQVDLETMKLIGTRQPFIFGDMLNHGWERSILRDGNRLRAPYVEGVWMNKLNGQYYLQYAAPGTQFSMYADGYYTSASPLGPFKYGGNNPFSLKSGGFITGAGHGSTFADRDGNLWHVATMRISVKHSFERRIGLFPAGIDDKGNLFCNTAFGDYPTNVPAGKWNPWADAFKGWMLLSYRKPATASSSVDQHTPELALNEDIRDYWAAKTSDPGEWLQVDLGSSSSVRAIQVNFAEHESKYWGREGEKLFYQYAVEGSVDGERWSKLIDRQTEELDTPHDYMSFTRRPKFAT